MTHARYLALAPLTLLLVACGSSADPNSTIATVRATEQAQLEAIVADDLRGAVRIYADEATRVAPGSAPLSGSESIGAMFERLLADPNFAIEMTPGPAFAATSGELAVTTSTVRVTSTDPVSGEAVTVPMANQTVWRKPTGMSWEIVSDYNVALQATE
jgi:ketosteroid isomerase-like protein